MKKLLKMLVVAGMLISAGCGITELAEKERNLQNTHNLEICNQRQQYFDEHLNLSPWMKQYVTDRDKVHFEPVTEEEHAHNVKSKTNIMESMIGWVGWALLCMF